VIEEPLSIRVDFNRADDDDIIWAFLDRASDPDALAVGSAARLYDFEGNECLGYVTRMADDVIYVRPEWTTWRDAAPVTIEVVEGAPELDLLGALRAAVEASRKSSLLSGGDALVQETLPVPRQEDLISTG
jgi:hypothetical protein